MKVNRFMYQINTIALWIVFTLASQAVLAEGQFPEPIALFDNAQVITEERTSPSNYTLALGPYEKSGNIWQAEKKQRVSGDLLKQTHEIPRSFNEQDVFEFYITQFGDDAKVLYDCEGFNCGSSNNWANDHFGIKQLYGLDRHQYYQVLEIESGSYVTVYVVRRGNRRIFAQIEIINPTE